MSAKKVKVKDMKTHRAFVITTKNNDGSETRKNIKCAYVPRDCSPDCAACELGGSFLQATCLRGDFILAAVEE